MAGRELDAAAREALLAGIRCVILDIDGVLTDGRVILGAEGLELLAFHVRDGFGIKRMLRAGLHVAVISGRSSVAARTRLEALGVTDIHQGQDDKLPAFEQILAEQSLAPATVLYVGDDTLDWPVMSRVGLAVTVADAHPALKAEVHWITRAAGGQGAEREVADALLAARGVDAFG